jgi:hypothetical protein
VDVAVLLTRLPHRRRVDDGHQLGQVLDEHAVEEDLVAVLEGRQPDVLLERVRLGSEVLDLELDLLLDGADPGGKQCVQPELIALLLREAEILVGRGVLQQPEATLARHDAVRPANHPRSLFASHWSQRTSGTAQGATRATWWLIVPMPRKGCSASSMWERITTRS